MVKWRKKYRSCGRRIQ